MSDAAPRVDAPDPEPTDEPTLPVSPEVMAAAQRAAIAVLEARAAAAPAPPVAPARPAARPIPQTAPEDRAEAAPRPPAARLRGFSPESESVIVAGVAVHEPALSVDIDFDAAPEPPPPPLRPAPGLAPAPALPPTPAPPPALAREPRQGTDTVPEPPQRRRRLESATVELPRAALRATVPPTAPAPDRTVLYAAIALSTIAALLLLANLLRG